jgi:hypothetical protein
MELNLKLNGFHDEWNYTIAYKKQSASLLNFLLRIP